jgi:hypothetical protein
VPFLHHTLLHAPISIFYLLSLPPPNRCDLGPWIESNNGSGSAQVLTTKANWCCKHKVRKNELPIFIMMLCFCSISYYSPTVPWSIHQPPYCFWRSRCFGPAADNKSKKGHNHTERKNICTFSFSKVISFFYD